LPVGPFDCAVGLRIIYGSKTKLRPYHVAKLSEILAVKFLPIIDCEFFGYTESADDLLLEEFSDGG
jgi:hypothetical protein